jgi:hypothetical protein
LDQTHNFFNINNYSSCELDGDVSSPVVLFDFHKPHFRLGERQATTSTQDHSRLYAIRNRIVG